VTGGQHGPHRGGIAHSLELQGDPTMRPIMFWLLGIPIPIIILLYVFNVV
jgi:hypothetical protein